MFHVSIQAVFVIFAYFYLTFLFTFLQEVIVPLLEIETTALICISTPQDSTNFYSMMFEMVDAGGEKLFNQIQLQMVCEDCKAGPNPHDCTHMKHLLPKWKSGAKQGKIIHFIIFFFPQASLYTLTLFYFQDMVRLIYGDNSADMLRESMGVTTNDTSSIFQENWLNLFASRPPYRSSAPPKVIYIACDPNGGGSSQMAIVSLYQQTNNFVICGMESHAVKGHGQVQTLLETHVRCIRSTFPQSFIIFIPESNLGHEASHMSHMLKRIPKCRSLMEKGEPGVLTTHKRKELYANTAVERFAAESIYYADRFVCMNPFDDANKRTAKVKKQFRKQLSVFSKIIVARGKDSYNLPKVVYSGKDQGEDDLVMTFMIGLYWGIQFITGRTFPNVKEINI